jgi:hypothetical protein
MTSAKVTYSVVVRDPNSWDAKTNINLLLHECGHNHKTIEAAEACHHRLLHSICSHGRLTGKPCSGCHGRAGQNSWSARWHNGRIEDSNGAIA